MKKVIIAIAGAMFILTACGEKEEKATATEPTEVETVASAEADAYKIKCFNCHGEPADGGSLHATPLTTYSVEEIIVAIQEGPKAMPKNLLNDEDGQKLAEWILTQK